MSQYEVEGEEEFFYQDEEDTFYDTINFGYGEEESEEESEEEEESEDEYDDGGEYDSELWHRRRIEITTNEELQDMEQTRANLLQFGEQYDVLPYLRCFNCAKIIGNLWEPFLTYTREKAYTSEDVIEALEASGVIVEDQKTELLAALDDPILFEQLLEDYDIKEDYDILISRPKYTNKEIFDQKLKIRPCCRQLFISPIHVPIKQSAFVEPQKTTTIPNPLLGSETDFMSISMSGEASLGSIC